MVTGNVQNRGQPIRRDAGREGCGKLGNQVKQQHSSSTGPTEGQSKCLRTHQNHKPLPLMVILYLIRPLIGKPSSETLYGDWRMSIERGK